MKKYLITCSGSKRKPVFNPSTIENLSFPKLSEHRREMINFSGVHLDWNYTLPAWELYSGRYSKLYPKVDIINWNKPCVDIQILSALFGWIKHNDLVPYYDLQMTDKIGVNKLATWKHW